MFPVWMIYTFFREAPLDTLNFDQSNCRESLCNYTALIWIFCLTMYIHSTLSLSALSLWQYWVADVCFWTPDLFLFSYSIQQEYISDFVCVLCETLACYIWRVVSELFSSVESETSTLLVCRVLVPSEPRDWLTWCLDPLGSVRGVHVQCGTDTGVRGWYTIKRMFIYIECGLIIPMWT